MIDVAKVASLSLAIVALLAALHCRFALRSRAVNEWMIIAFGSMTARRFADLFHQPPMWETVCGNLLHIGLFALWGLRLRRDVTERHEESYREGVKAAMEQRQSEAAEAICKEDA